MEKSIRRSLSVLLAVVLALTAVSAAFAGRAEKTARNRAADAIPAETESPAKTEGGLTYIVSNGQAVVIAADDTVRGEVAVPGTLGGAPVGVIGMGAFKGNGAITSVTLPDSVTVVDEQAFADCAALERIACGSALETLPESAYAGCGKLNNRILFAGTNGNFPADEAGAAVYNKDKTELLLVAEGFSGQFTVPESVTYVRAGAFRNCAGLTEVVFAGASTAIGAYAFAACTGLTKAVLPANLAEIKEGTFSGCTSLGRTEVPRGVTAIGAGAFENCVRLPDFIVPVNCADIGSGAFAGCAGLTSVTFLSSMTALSDELFAGCAALKDLKLPEGLTAVGDKTFYSCAALEDVGNVLSYRQIGRDAFTGTAWYAKQVDTAYIAGDTLLFWKGACDASVDLSGKKITAIAPGAFSGCDTLKTITLPDSVTSIGEAAFEGCAALDAVNFKGVAKIGAHAFEGTAFLASADGGELYLGANLIKAASPAGATSTDAASAAGTADSQVYIVPQNVKSIAGGAFDGADPAIGEIVLPEGLEIISNGAFDGLPGLKTVNSPSTLKYNGWQPSGPACVHANKTVKYADAENCTKAYFTGCTYCTDCAALLEIGALREAAGHRFSFVRQETDPTLGETVRIVVCTVCKTEKRVTQSEYNVRFDDNDKAKAEGDDYVVVAPETDMTDVLAGCPEGTLVLNAAGERLPEDKTPGSGMRLLFPSSRGYIVILFGDGDGDGSISPADARIALRRSVKLDEEFVWRDKACHVTYDGKSAVQPEDARLILRASVRMEDPAAFGRERKTLTPTDADPPTTTEADPPTTTEAEPPTATETDPPTDAETDPPPTTEADPEPPSGTDKTYQPGTYVCMEAGGVYLRENHSRSTLSVDVIHCNDTVTVTEIWCDTGAGEKVYWGKTEHNGKTGWTMLEYYEFKQENARG